MIGQNQHINSNQKDERNALCERQLMWHLDRYRFLPLHGDGTRGLRGRREVVDANWPKLVHLQ
jgi:hypothetical protein